MEKTNDINRLLKEALDPKYLNLEAPEISRMSEARNIVLLREQTNKQDIFALLASFLNLKIKLYHAVIASIVIWICVMVFQKEDSTHHEVSAEVPQTNLAAINNSTLLPSIQTCITRK